jgi:hypothetical protein
MKIFWVGLESADFPQGHGEDHRVYVTVQDGEDDGEKIQAAVLHIAKEMTNMEDGDRIAVRLMHEPGKGEING